MRVRVRESVYESVFVCVCEEEGQARTGHVSFNTPPSALLLIKQPVFLTRVRVRSEEPPAARTLILSS